MFFFKQPFTNIYTACNFGICLKKPNSDKGMIIAMVMEVFVDEMCQPS